MEVKHVVNSRGRSHGRGCGRGHCLGPSMRLLFMHAYAFLKQQEVPDSGPSLTLRGVDRRIGIGIAPSRSAARSKRCDNH